MKHQFSEIQNIKTFIQPIYDTFSCYKLNQDMFHCPCCISQEEAAILYLKDFRIMDKDDFGNYPGKALSTWGDVQDFKHFLPRILELESYNDYGLHYLSSKFEYANFSAWPSSEKESLENFFYNYFIYLINKGEVSDALDLVVECKKFLPNFLSSHPHFEDYIKKCCYESLNKTDQPYDSCYSELISNAFGEHSLIDYLLSWPEDEEGILKFAFFINDCESAFATLNKVLKIKFSKMKRLLENHWYNSVGQNNTRILNQISLAITVIESCWLIS